MSSIAIAKLNPEGKYNLIIIEGESDKELVSDLLKNNYTEEAKINGLFDGGNIISLAPTVEETVFSGNSSQIIENIDIRESEITICDYNFLYDTENGWMVREFSQDFYSLLSRA